MSRPKSKERIDPKLINKVQDLVETQQMTAREISEQLGVNMGTIRYIIEGISARKKEEGVYQLQEGEIAYGRTSTNPQDFEIVKELLGLKGLTGRIIARDTRMPISLVYRISAAVSANCNSIKEYEKYLENNKKKRKAEDPSLKYRNPHARELAERVSPVPSPFVRKVERQPAKNPGDYQTPKPIIR